MKSDEVTAKMKRLTVIFVSRMGQSCGQRWSRTLFRLLGAALWAATACRTAAAQPVHERLIYSHPLTGTQSDQGLILRNIDGHFLANGWESTSATSH